MHVYILIPTVYIIHYYCYLYKKNEIDVHSPMVRDNELYTSPLPNNPTIPKKYSVQRSRAPIGLTFCILYALLSSNLLKVSDYNRDGCEYAISKTVESCMNAHGHNSILRLSRCTNGPCTTFYISTFAKITSLHAYRVLSYITSRIVNLNGFERARIVERRCFNLVSRVLV